MIQLIRQMHGFSFRIFEDEIEAQDVISPRSLDLNFDLKRSLDVETSQEHEEINLALELVSGQFEFLTNSRVRSSFVKNTYLKEKFWARSSDEEAPLDKQSR